MTLTQEQEAATRPLAGRVAVVTGAGRGIGAATAQLLAQRGAEVLLSDVDQEEVTDVAESIERDGGRSRAVTCDVTERQDVRKLMSEAVSHFDGLDILVTCAGVTRDNLIHKLTEEDWGAVIESHLKGTFLCVQAAQEIMVPARFGNIVLVSSGAARGNRGQVNYSAAKAGIQGMTYTLSLELGKFNIRVNAVAPGFIETRMTRSVAERIGVDWEEFKERRASDIPLGRTGMPGDVASVIGFLCSPEASYVSGQVIHVRGGP